jgi:acetylglutamate kinase
MTKPCIVIKFGGEIVEHDQDLSNLVESAKALSQNHDVVLVHGGGPFATQLSSRLGIETQKVGGRRITDQETLDVMKMTLPGVINSNILAKMKSKGLKGSAVSGISVVKAHKRPPKAVTGSEGKKVDFGFVGDIDSVETDLIEHLLSKSFLPVVSPLTSDDKGVCLNINADTVAVQIARGLKAKHLVLVTKVGGVFEDIDKPESRIKNMTIAESKAKIESGIIQGGMIPKLEESYVLLEEGMDGFHIVGVDSPGTIANEIRKPGSQGTAVRKG